MLDAPKASECMEILVIGSESAAQSKCAIEALAWDSGPSNLTILEDGVEALTYLQQGGKVVPARLPDLIVVDLSWNREAGSSVLAEIKRDPALRQIPTVIVSAGRDGPELIDAYGIRTSGFLTGPADLDRYVRIIESIVLRLTILKGSGESQWGALANRSELLN